MAYLINMQQHYQYPKVLKNQFQEGEQCFHKVWFLVGYINQVLFENLAKEPDQQQVHLLLMHIKIRLVAPL